MSGKYPHGSVYRHQRERRFLRMDKRATTTADSSAAAVTAAGVTSPVRGRSLILLL